MRRFDSIHLLLILLSAGIAVWVYSDARRRDARPAWLWALGTFSGLGVLPFFIAFRPLLPGEIRRGGRAWHVLRNVAIFWIVFVGLFLTATGVGALSTTPVRGGFVHAVGFFALLALPSVLPSLILLLIGRLVRRPDVVERDDRPASDARFDRHTGEAHPPTKMSWQPIAILGAMLALGIMFAVS